MPILLSVPLLLLALVIVSMGMPFMQHAASKGIVQWFVKAVQFVGSQENYILQQAVRLTRWVTHEIGKDFLATYRLGVRWISALEQYTYITMYWALLWPIVLAHEVDHLRHRFIPRAIKAQTLPIKRTAERAEVEAKAAAGTAHAAPAAPATTVHTTVTHTTVRNTTQRVTTVERVAMPHAREWEWVHRHFHALQHALTGAAVEAVAVPLPHAPAWIGRTARQVRHLNRRLARVEKLLGVAGFAAILARTLGVSLRCVRPGGNVARAARHLCGLPTHWLEDIFGLLGDFLILENICDVLPWVETAASAVALPLTTALTTLTTHNRGCLSKVAPTYDTPALHLPSVVDSLTAGR